MNWVKQSTTCSNRPLTAPWSLGQFFRDFAQVENLVISPESLKTTNKLTLEWRLREFQPKRKFEVGLG